MKWLSMRDNTPPLNISCLVNTPSNYDYGFDVAKWDGDSWWYTEDSCYYNCSNVTHFCIPDPIPIED